MTRRTSDPEHAHPRPGATRDFPGAATTDIAIHSFAEPPEPELNRLLRSLVDHAVEHFPGTDAAADDCRARVVLFDRLDSDVLRFVSRAARAGRRVLALGTGDATAASAWQMLGAGAADVLSAGQWTARPDIVGEKLTRWSEIDDLAGSPEVAGRLVGSSALWRTLVREVVEVGRFTTSPVLITGPTGTGKELVARTIHDLDTRLQKGPFVVLDCTTIVESLSGSEFFGHDKGAFTGAVAARDGAFALADGGTLFLDEIGELPLPLQSELLRVVQEGTYKRVGSSVWRQTSFRLICATNRDLEREKDGGRFRADLYYRIAAWRLRTPSLEERPEDIPDLVDHFLAELSDGKLPEVDPAVADHLATRSYPGNVRELRHLVTRIFFRHSGGTVTIGDLPDDERPAPASSGAAGALDDSPPGRPPAERVETPA